MMKKRITKLLTPISLLLILLLGFLFLAAANVDFKKVNAVSIKIEAIYLKGQEDLFIPPGAEGQLEAKISPDSYQDKLEIKWEIEPSSQNLLLTIDKASGIIRVDKDSPVGHINVMASAVGLEPKKQRIEINCSCGNQEDCKSPPGSGGGVNESIDVRLSLGKTSEGRSAGDLFLYAKEPSEALSTPEGLTINSSTDEVMRLYRDDSLQQIIAPQVVVNFVRFSPQKYEIYFYDISDRGQELEDGFFNIDPAATPTAVWRIENPDASGKTIDKLVVTEQRDGVKREYLYNYLPDGSGWTLVSNNGQKIDTKKEFTNADGDRVTRRAISGADGKPVSVEETVYRKFDFGEKRIREITDADGERLTTEYQYITATDPGYGKLESRVDPDGSWIRYTYDQEGRIIRETQPFLDAATDSPDNKAVVSTLSYEPVDNADTRAEGNNHRPRLVTKTVSGIETARTYYAYITAKDGSRTKIVEKCTRQGSPYGDPANLRSMTNYYANVPERPESGRIKSRLFPDGRLITYTYDTGEFRFSIDPAKSVFNPGKGKARRTTSTYGTQKHPDGIPFQTTRETTIVDSFGLEKMRETFVHTDSGFERIDWQLNTHNRLGQVIETLHANGTRAESEYDCCGKVSETDANGITTRFTYDAAKRVISQTNTAAGVVTEFTYDADGRRLITAEKKDELNRTNENRYDSAGRMVESIDPAGLITRYEEGKNTSAVIYPGGATEITIRHLDGRIRSVTGSAVLPRYYSYGVNPDGSQWTTVFIGSEDSPRWEKITRDVAARVIRVERPGFAGIELTENTYDHLGYLTRTRNSEKTTTIYEYDSIGNMIRAVIDVNRDGKITPASMDRITTSSTRYVKIGNDWWQESSRTVFAHDNSDRETVVSTQRRRLTGWKSKTISETVSIDIHGNETKSFVTLDRNKKTRIQTTHFPDSDIPAQSVSVNGLLVASTDKTGVTTRFAYDGLGRRIAVENPRKGVSTTHYDNNSRVDFIEDAAGNRTRFEYDPDTGQKIAEYNPHSKATRYAYNTRGQVIRTWGDVPYPAEHVYDSFGQMVVMQTFRSGKDWSGTFWPKDTGTADETRWHYQKSTGLLLAKEDAQGNSTTYTYATGGALASRTWARTKDGKPVVTSYQYAQATGEMVRIDYSDDTPDIAFAYDRLGRKTRVSDVAGVHSFVYNEKLQLVIEGLTGEQIYKIDRKYDDRGRATGFALGDGYDTTYGYDKTGRFETINWRIGEQTDRVDYRYMENSAMLAGMRSESGLSVTYEYEFHRDVRTTVDNQFNDRLISRYEYEYDRLGRRINIRSTGEAFEKTGFSLYGYNDRNEIHTAGRFNGEDLNDQTRPIVDQDRVYNFDPIGNRIGAIEGKRETQYPSNSLNQYEAIKKWDGKEADLAYDKDGNLNEDDRFHYFWNGENRLVAVQSKEGTADPVRLEFAYDYMGRRVQKKVYTYSPTTHSLQSNHHFIYDGWNMLREVKTATGTSVDNYYVWGLDLSQSLHAAGGVGGLIATSFKSTTYLYSYDANGNVGQLTDSQHESITARYEYDPFGKTIGAGGKYANENPYRYSTKYFDVETALHYYGFRYYDGYQGRWLSRDPLGENGGAHLYRFNSNSINRIDTNGYYSYDIHYLAVFATLQAAGYSPSDAWEIAYYSCYPDMDLRYDAPSNFLAALFGDENAEKYQEYLHSLNGMDMVQIGGFRTCIKCLIKNNPEMKTKMKEDEIEGILLHILGDTYSHLEMKFIRNEERDIIGYETGDGAYSGPFGHGHHITYPDIVAYRPQLAVDYLMSVFELYGGKDIFIMNKIVDAMFNLKEPSPFYDPYEDLQMKLSSDYFSDDGLEKYKRNFVPRPNGMIPEQDLISPESMVELIDILIDCTERVNQ